MPKRTETKHQGKYYRKRVRLPDGSGYRDVYGKTQDERDAKVQALLRQYEEGGALARRDAVFFYEYAAAWYKRKSPHMSHDWQATARRYINNVICPVIGQKALDEVTSDDLADIMATVAEKSRSYQKSLVQLLKQIFEAAEEAEEIRKSPARKLKPGGSPPAKKNALTKGQEETLLRAVSGQKIETFVLLALYAGLRREEALGLCWDCVDLQEDAPHIDVRRACRWKDNFKPEISELLKSDAAARTIPIPPRLADHLAQLQAKLPEDARQSAMPVIHGEDGSALTYSAFRSRWNAIRVRSTESGRALGEKVPQHPYAVTIDFHVRPHILRHTYITRLILAGVSVKRVQYLAGHADPDITLAIYTDLMEHAPKDLIGDIRATFGGGEFTPASTPKAPE